MRWADYTSTLARFVPALYIGPRAVAAFCRKYYARKIAQVEAQQQATATRQVWTELEAVNPRNPGDDAPTIIVEGESLGIFIAPLDLSGCDIEIVESSSPHEWAGQTVLVGEIVGDGSLHGGAVHCAALFTPTRGDDDDDI